MVLSLALLVSTAAVVSTTTAVPRPMAALTAPKLDARLPRSLDAAFDGRKKRAGGEWYASWGYNKTVWAPSTIRVEQPGRGSAFTLREVEAHDEPPWKTGLWNGGDITYSQYTMRLGRWLGKDKVWGVEYGHDHTKYTSTIGQSARVSGTIEGAPVDRDMVLSDDVFRYHLHNGVNYEMLSVVRRLPLVGRPGETGSVAGIARAGAGLILTHAENKVMGHELDPGPKTRGHLFGTTQGWWQLDGWCAGVEAGVRWVVRRPVFLELSDRVAYANLSGIPVYEGTASHQLRMNQLTLSLGLALNSR